jgi:hypothetical protein
MNRVVMTSQHDNDWFSASPEFSHSFNGSDTDKTQKTDWGKIIEINNVHKCGREMKAELLLLANKCTGQFNTTCNHGVTASVV